MKIAMWSGPRNLSTALMYSFANRRDMCAVDEPFYAAYLSQTGLNHPMRDDVIMSQNVNTDDVISDLLSPHDAQHQYQKHMTQHMLPTISRNWLSHVNNIFLIRHPARVLASWTNKHDVPNLSDIGFSQQLDIYERVIAMELPAVIVESSDIRARPEQTLRALCSAIGLKWDPAMLTWPSGPKPFDGVWAKHWYDAVHRSTCFSGEEGELPALSGKLAEINKEALPLYQRLAALKLSV